MAETKTDTKIEVIMANPEMNELVVRHGEAAQVYDPVEIALTGTITAPGDWYDNRKSKIDVLSGHVVAEYDDRTITLVLDERDHFSTLVTGSLELHPELKTLQVNATKMYSHKDLYNILKFKGAFFADRDAHTLLLSKLRQFDATIHKEIQAANDYKGSEAQRKIVEVKTNLDLQFQLTMPIFAGMGRHTFTVEIMVDGETGAPRFWLESVELHDLIVAETERIFEQELARLQPFALVSSY